MLTVPCYGKSLSRIIVRLNVSTHPGSQSFTFVLVEMAMVAYNSTHKYDSVKHSLHFTTLKFFWVFFHRISATQTEIQSCCTSGEENV